MASDVRIGERPRFSRVGDPHGERRVGPIQGARRSAGRRRVPVSGVDHDIHSARPNAAGQCGRNRFTVVQCIEHGCWVSTPAAPCGTSG